MKKIISIIIVILISININFINVKAETLPKIFFTGNIDNMKTREDERKIQIRYISNDLEFNAYAKIKIQGGTSIFYDKKNYTIKLYNDKSLVSKKKIDVGFGKENKYYLKANWVDKTHSRNIVTSNIIANIQNKYKLLEDTPNNGQIDGFPVEVYINNNFLGLYTLNIPKDEWLFNMDKDNPNHIAMMANDRGKSTRFKEETTLKNQDWEVEIGSETEDTIDKFNRLITFIKDSSDQEFKDNIHKYLNLDATLNYYCIVNYAGLVDNIDKNMLLITYDGKIWYPTLYDLDTSWGTDWNGKKTIDYKQDLNNEFNESLLWKKLVDNFPNEIANRYFELRKTILDKDYIIKQFNNFYKKIPSVTLKKEQEKWGDSIPGYDIVQIKEFIDIRTPIVDKLMYDLYDTTPTVNVLYSTKNITFKPVDVTLNANRNDLVIIKNNKKSYDYVYTFLENGKYTYEYQDWFGNYVGTITIDINNIYTKVLRNFVFSVTLLFIGLVLFFTSKPKKEIENKEKLNDEVITEKKNKVNKKRNNSNTKKRKTSNKEVKTSDKKTKTTRNSKKS